MPPLSSDRGPAPRRGCATRHPASCRPALVSTSACIIAPLFFKLVEHVAIVAGAVLDVLGRDDTMAARSDSRRSSPLLISEDGVEQGRARTAARRTRVWRVLQLFLVGGVVAQHRRPIGDGDEGDRADAVDVAQKGGERLAQVRDGVGGGLAVVDDHGDRHRRGGRADPQHLAAGAVFPDDEVVVRSPVTGARVFSSKTLTYSTRSAACGEAAPRARTERRKGEEAPGCETNERSSRMDLTFQAAAEAHRAAVQAVYRPDPLQYTERAAHLAQHLAAHRPTEHDWHVVRVCAGDRFWRRDIGSTASSAPLPGCLSGFLPGLAAGILNVYRVMQLAQKRQ